MASKQRGVVKVEEDTTFMIDGEAYYIQEAGNGIVVFSVNGRDAEFTEPAGNFKERLETAHYWTKKDGVDVSEEWWENSYSGGYV